MRNIYFLFLFFQNVSILLFSLPSSLSASPPSTSIWYMSRCLSDCLMCLYFLLFLFLLLFTPPALGDQARYQL
ncbi:hypothetical protein B0T13DRAFT_473866 [Neurospora crassa]|nr:hypothetical protein B0T13DRAFT_473866 [Neurospora crassa]